MAGDHRIAPVLLATALAAVGCSTFATISHAAGALDPYLPASNSIQGHVVTFAVAPADQDISQRFRRAVQNNMDWFKNAVTSNKSGQPLPYDKKMGITEAEYDRLQHLKPELKEGAAVTVAVERKGDGTITFKPAATEAQSLKDVTVPPGEKQVDTPFGALTIFNAIHQQNAAGPLGAWEGAEWAKVEPADAEQPSAKLAFGKRTDGSGVLYFQVAPYKDHEEQSLVIVYKLADAAAEGSTAEK